MRYFLFAILVLSSDCSILLGNQNIISLSNTSADGDQVFDLEFNDEAIDPAKQYVFAASLDLRSWITVGEPSVVESGRATGEIELNKNASDSPFFVILTETDSVDELTIEEVENLKEELLANLQEYVSAAMSESTDPELDALLSDLQDLFLSTFEEMSPEQQDSFVKALYSNGTLDDLASEMEPNANFELNTKFASQPLEMRTANFSLADENTFTWQQIVDARTKVQQRDSYSFYSMVGNIALKLVTPGARELELLRILDNTLGLIFEARSLAQIYVPMYMTKFYAEVAAEDSALLMNLTMDPLVNPKVNFYADFISDENFLADITFDGFRNKILALSKVEFDGADTEELVRIIEEEYAGEEPPTESQRNKLKELFEKLRGQEITTAIKVPITDISYFTAENLRLRFEQFNFYNIKFDRDSQTIVPKFDACDIGESDRARFNLKDGFTREDTFYSGWMDIAVILGEHGGTPELLTTNNAEGSLEFSFPRTLPERARYNENLDVAYGSAKIIPNNEGELRITYKIKGSDLPDDFEANVDYNPRLGLLGTSVGTSTIKATGKVNDTLKLKIDTDCSGNRFTLDTDLGPVTADAELILDDLFSFELVDDPQLGDSFESYEIKNNEDGTAEFSAQLKPNAIAPGSGFWEFSIAVKIGDAVLDTVTLEVFPSAFSQEILFEVTEIKNGEKYTADGGTMQSTKSGSVGDTYTDNALVEVFEDRVIIYGLTLELQGVGPIKTFDETFETGPRPVEGNEEFTERFVERFSGEYNFATGSFTATYVEDQYLSWTLTPDVSTSRKVESLTATFPPFGN